MSIKALHAVLQQASSWGCVDGVTDSPCAHCAVVAARAELHAIERAAKTMDRWNRDGQKALDPDMARAWTLMESIGKDAK